MFSQYKIDINTPGRGIIDVTDDVAKCVSQSNVSMGICHVFLHHTSASLILCENADPLVQRDLEAFMQRLIPDGDPICQHVAEGPDDMPSHVRTILTSSFLTIPIQNNKLGLGTWQGIYIWEHRVREHHRKLTVTVQGN